MKQFSNLWRRPADSQRGRADTGKDYCVHSKDRGSDDPTWEKVLDRTWGSKAFLGLFSLPHCFTVVKIHFCSAPIILHSRVQTRSCHFTYADDTMNNVPLYIHNNHPHSTLRYLTSHFTSTHNHTLVCLSRHTYSSEPSLSSISHTSRRRNSMVTYTHCLAVGMVRLILPGCPAESTNPLGTDTVWHCTYEADDTCTTISKSRGVYRPSFPNTAHPRSRRACSSCIIARSPITSTTHKSHFTHKLPVTLP